MRAGGRIGTSGECSATRTAS